MDLHTVERTLSVTTDSPELGFAIFLVDTYERCLNILNDEMWKKTSYLLDEIVQDLYSDYDSRLLDLLETHTSVSVEYSNGSEGINSQRLNQMIKLLLDWCRDNVDYGENLSDFEIETRIKIEENRRKIVDIVPTNLLW